MKCVGIDSFFRLKLLRPYILYNNNETYNIYIYINNKYNPQIFSPLWPIRIFDTCAVGQSAHFCSPLTSKGKALSLKLCLLLTIFSSRWYEVKPIHQKMFSKNSLCDFLLTLYFPFYGNKSIAPQQMSFTLLYFFYYCIHHCYSLVHFIQYCFLCFIHFVPIILVRGHISVFSLLQIFTTTTTTGLTFIVHVCCRG